MQKTAATTICPNPNCQAPNPESHNYCEKCRTPLPKRYLWAANEVMKVRSLSESLGDRYALKQQRIYLDTKPGLPPEAPTDIPREVLPYLRLFPYRLHVPQPYALVPSRKGGSAEVLLLESAPVNVPRLESGETDNLLLPELTSLWKDARAMRQLNWLWQIAQLWQHFSMNGVAASLLEERLLRLDGRFVRLLELKPDPRSAPTLEHLGKLWAKWAESAQPEIADFLKLLSEQLMAGRLHSSEQLVAKLDEALTHCSISQSVQFEMVTRTDTGPSRQRNEDACYANSKIRGTSERTSHLAIVCDGIGGHEGGNVASNLAIKTIWQQMQRLSVAQTNTNIQFALSQSLENAVRDANDAIARRNDRENRHERQRMGTTVVMALAYPGDLTNHELYIAHIGDSRIYWITPTGCYQITLDDDVASREVRLGYAFYRDALQQPTSGSLIQALGMSSSMTLHPTVGRFILDEDCVFLLCSDGLSDRDRVEQNWQAEILPILQGRADLETAAERLIEIANSQNGHDNVTVGLLHCQVRSTDGKIPPLTQPDASSTSSATAVPEVPDYTASTRKAEVSPQEEEPSILGLLAGIIFLLGVVAVGAYFLIESVQIEVNRWFKQPDREIERLPAEPAPSSTEPVSPDNSIETRSPVTNTPAVDNSVEETETQPSVEPSPTPTSKPESESN